MNLDSATDKIDLTGQVAIVTGGGRGLGRAFAQALAGAGAAVAMLSRTESELRETVALIEGAGGQAIAQVADVTDRVAIEDAVQQTERRLGPVDLVVNSAGVMCSVGYAWEVNPEDWWREIEVNLRGSFLSARAVLPGMLARGRGRIINLASGAGLVMHPGISAYCISKAAVIRLTEGLAADTGARGITVFAMHPGTVRTPLNDQALTLGSAYISAVPESAREQHSVIQFVHGFRRIFEQGRDTPIERSVQLLLFLASGKADALSGRFIGVSEDWASMAQRAEEIRHKDLYTLRLRK